MAVDVEIRFVPMPTLAHKISHPADRKDVSGPVEGESIGGIQTLASQNLLVNGTKAGVFGLKRVMCVRSRHCLDDIAGISLPAIATDATC